MKAAAEWKVPPFLKVNAKLIKIVYNLRIVEFKEGGISCRDFTHIFCSA